MQASQPMPPEGQAQHPVVRLRIVFHTGPQTVLSLPLTLQELSSWAQLLSHHALVLKQVLGVSAGNAGDKSLSIAGATLEAAPGPKRALAFWKGVYNAVRHLHSEPDSADACATIRCAVHSGNAPAALPQLPLAVSPSDDAVSRSWLLILQSTLQTAVLATADFRAALSPVPPSGVLVPRVPGAKPLFASPRPPTAVVGSGDTLWVASGCHFISLAPASVPLKAAVPGQGTILCACPGQAGAVLLLAQGAHTGTASLWEAQHGPHKIDMQCISAQHTPCRLIAQLTPDLLALTADGRSVEVTDKTGGSSWTAWTVPHPDDIITAIHAVQSGLLLIAGSTINNQTFLVLSSMHSDSAKTLFSQRGLPETTSALGACVDRLGTNMLTCILPHTQAEGRCTTLEWAAPEVAGGAMAWNPPLVREKQLPGKWTTAPLGALTSSGTLALVGQLPVECPTCPRPSKGDTDSQPPTPPTGAGDIWLSGPRADLHLLSQLVTPNVPTQTTRAWVVYTSSLSAMAAVAPSEAASHHVYAEEALVEAQHRAHALGKAVHDHESGATAHALAAAKGAGGRQAFAPPHSLWEDLQAYESDEVDALQHSPSRAMHQTIGQEHGKSSMRVMLRCRPLLAKEIAEGARPAIHCRRHKVDVDRYAAYVQAKSYTFHRVFGTTTSQRQLFEEGVLPTVVKVLQGFNCTVFAYGQTGTGKTFTLEGTPRPLAHPGGLRLHKGAGIIPRALLSLFSRLQQMPGTSFSLTVSHLEIYKERVYDLLKGAAHPQPLATQAASPPSATQLLSTPSPPSHPRSRARTMSNASPMSAKHPRPPSPAEGPTEASALRSSARVIQFGPLPATHSPSTSPPVAACRRGSPATPAVLRKLRAPKPRAATSSEQAAAGGALRFVQGDGDGLPITGLEEVQVHTPQQVLDLLQHSSAQRRTHETKMNIQSSRSHALFSVKVEVRQSLPGGQHRTTQGRLNMVDLSGSENVKRSGSQAERFSEASLINRGLLSLGRVIKAVVEKAPHIPYRESKLTRLLAGALGGSALATMILAVSPSHIDAEETVATLNYAHMAKEVYNKPVQQVGGGGTLSMPQRLRKTVRCATAAPRGTEYSIPWAPSVPLLPAATHMARATGTAGPLQLDAGRLATKLLRQHPPPSTAGGSLTDMHNRLTKVVTTEVHSQQQGVSAMAALAPIAPHPAVSHPGGDARWIQEHVLQRQDEGWNAAQWSRFGAPKLGMTLTPAAVALVHRWACRETGGDGLRLKPRELRVLLASARRHIFRAAAGRHLVSAGPCSRIKASRETGSLHSPTRTGRPHSAGHVAAGIFSTQADVEGEDAGRGSDTDSSESSNEDAQTYSEWLASLSAIGDRIGCGGKVDMPKRQLHLGDESGFSRQAHHRAHLHLIKTLRLNAQNSLAAAAMAWDPTQTLPAQAPRPTGTPKPQFQRSDDAQPAHDCDGAAPHQESSPSSSPSWWSFPAPHRGAAEPGSPKLPQPQDFWFRVHAPPAQETIKAVRRELSRVGAARHATAADVGHVQAVRRAVQGVHPMWLQDPASLSMGTGDSLPLHRLLAFIQQVASSQPTACRHLFRAMGARLPQHFNSAFEPPTLDIGMAQQGRSSVHTGQSAVRLHSEGVGLGLGTGLRRAAVAGGLGQRAWRNLQSEVGQRDEQLADTMQWLTDTVPQQGVLSSAHREYVDTCRLFHQLESPFKASVGGGEAAVRANVPLPLSLLSLLGAAGTQHTPTSASRWAEGLTSSSGSCTVLAHIAAGEQPIRHQLGGERGSLARQLGPWILPSQHSLSTIRRHLFQQLHQLEAILHVHTASVPR